MRSAIQCSCDRIVVEVKGFPSNDSSLFRVIGQYVVQDIVDVWELSFPELRPAEIPRASLT